MSRFFILLVLSSVTLQAQVYSLEEVIQMSLENNGLVESRKRNLESYSFEKKNVGLPRNPVVTVMGGGMSNRNDAQILPSTSGAVYMQGSSSSGSTMGVSVSIPVRFPGKKGLQKGIVDAKAGEAGAELEAARLFIIQEIIRVVYSREAVVEKLDHALEEKEKLDLALAFLKSRPVNSPRMRLDHEIAKSRSLLLNKRIQALESEKNSLDMELGFYLKAENAPKISVEWFRQGVTFDSDDVMSRVLKSNIDLKKRAIRSDEIEKKMKLARKKKYPDMNLIAQYNRETSGGLQQFASFGVSFQLPVMNTGGNEADYYKKRLDALSSENEYFRQKAVVDTKRLLAEYESHRRIIEQIPYSSFKNLHKGLDYAEREFRRGRITVGDFLGFLEQAHDAHTEIIDTQMEFLEKYLSLLNMLSEEKFEVR